MTMRLAFAYTLGGAILFGVAGFTTQAPPPVRRALPSMPGTITSTA